MSVNVETLEKLERRITLTLPAADIGNEVQARLKKLARTVKADGFRPGKVPMSVVAQRYGYSVQYEVMNDRVGQAFSDAATQAKLRVAGAPRISAKDGAPDGQLAFDAVFEVYPEVTISDLAGVPLERVSAEVTEAAIERTIEILRKQRRTFAQRPAAEGAQETDRVTVDFHGTIDGESFAGGKAEGFAFVVGEGQMLEAFDRAVRGMKVGDSKTFPLKFPDDYQGKDVAGKEADFLVTLKKCEAQHLAEVDEAFVKALGIEGGTLEALREDVTKNLEREVRFRVQQRNKAAAMAALVGAATLEVPNALVESEAERLVGQFRERLKQQGMKDADKVPVPAAEFRPQAEQRVRLGLVVAELVRSRGLQARPEQLQKHLEDVSQSYEKPAEVVRWYLSDRQRMAEVEGVVVENNVTEHVFANAAVTDRTVPFDELMNAS
jgi:trigger factor